VSGFKLSGVSLHIFAKVEINGITVVSEETAVQFF
jgi:hypothetical protein